MPKQLFLCFADVMYVSVYYLSFLRDKDGYCSRKIVLLRKLSMAAFNLRQMARLWGPSDLVLLGHDLTRDRTGFGNKFCIVKS